MALDTETFQKRALTAIVFVAVMLAGLCLNAASFIVLFTIIHFGCWYELVKLVKKIKPFSWAYFLPLGLLYITLPILLILIFGFPDLIAANRHIDEYEWAYSPWLPCAIIFSIWINDTMAYIVGSFIGRTPMSKISPKKTWEGTIGGALLCVIVISSIGSVAGHFSNTDWIIIAACCAVFGTLGDLLESKIKRLAGVKDSGNFMPGHGGFLDRFDSLLVASIAVGCYYYFYMQTH